MTSEPSATREARSTPQAILASLLAQLGLSEHDTGGSILIEGDDPVVDSRHRPAAAAAAALAAQGAGVAAIWKMRSGLGQDVAVEARRAAVPGLRTINYMRQNGHAHDLFPRSTKGFNDFFRTRDNRRMYIMRTTLYPDNLIGVLDLLQCRSDAIAEAVARWDGRDLEGALAQRKLVGVLARSREEWLRHPQGQWLAARPVVEVEKIGESAPQPFGPGPRPLSDVRVLDFTHLLAGPVASRMFAEQGADVLHILAQHQMDPIRLAIDTGPGKRSAFLDLDKAADLERLRDLSRRADVFVQSWRPGALERRGLSAEELAAQRPGLIYVSASAYGTGGPWASRGGYEPVGQVACGLAIDEGSADAPRLAVTGTLNDYLSAYLAAAGAFAALIRRAREGGSYHVKVSLTRTSMWLQELGRLPQAEWPAGPVAMEPQPDDLMQMESPFGRVTIPAPITRYSRTPARWERPPEPFGASLPTWLPRPDRLDPT